MLVEARPPPGRLRGAEAQRLREVSITRLCGGERNRCAAGGTHVRHAVPEVRHAKTQVCHAKTQVCHGKTQVCHGKTPVCRGRNTPVRRTRRRVVVRATHVRHAATAVCHGKTQVCRARSTPAHRPRRRGVRRATHQRHAETHLCRGKTTRCHARNTSVSCPGHRCVAGPAQVRHRRNTRCAAETRAVTPGAQACRARSNACRRSSTCASGRDSGVSSINQYTSSPRRHFDSAIHPDRAWGDGTWFLPAATALRTCAAFPACIRVARSCSPTRPPPQRHTELDSLAKDLATHTPIRYYFGDECPNCCPPSGIDDCAHHPYPGGAPAKNCSGCGAMWPEFRGTGAGFAAPPLRRGRRYRSGAGRDSCARGSQSR